MECGEPKSIHHLNLNNIHTVDWTWACHIINIVQQHYVVEKQFLLEASQIQALMVIWKPGLQTASKLQTFA